MRVFKSKAFAKFAKKEKVSNAMLCEAVRSANDGLVDANYGAGVIKQRIARAGKGKAGGFRTIVLFRQEERAFFVYGFAKNDRENIAADELVAFKKLARVTLSLGEHEIEAMLANGTYVEVKCHD